MRYRILSVKTVYEAANISDNSIITLTPILHADTVLEGYADDIFSINERINIKADNENDLISIIIECECGHNSKKSFPLKTSAKELTIYTVSSIIRKNICNRAQKCLTK